MKAKPTHTILRCADIGVQGAFYRRFFDQAPMIDRPHWWVFNLSGWYFSLEQSDGESGGNALMVALECDDLDGEAKRLAANEMVPCRPEKEIKEDDGRVYRWLVYRDPEGNEIGIYGS